jgi:ribosomal protein S18 acetylase RimI-like enzyme
MRCPTMPSSLTEMSTAECCYLMESTAAEAAAGTAGGEVRACRPSDLPRVAEIHQAQLRSPGALLARLSPGLLAEFYAAFLQPALFLVHSQDGEVDGFAVGGPPAVLSRCRLALLRDHGLRCLLEIARRPRLWLRTPRTFGKLLGSNISSPFRGPPRDEVLLLAIAVDSRATRRGVGTALVRGFEDAAGKLSHAYWLDVQKTNGVARRFYEKLALQFVEETPSTLILRKVLAQKVSAASAPAA